MGTAPAGGRIPEALLDIVGIVADIEETDEKEEVEEELEEFGKGVHR